MNIATYGFLYNYVKIKLYCDLTKERVSLKTPRMETDDEPFSPQPTSTEREMNSKFVDALDAKSSQMKASTYATKSNNFNSSPSFRRTMKRKPSSAAPSPTTITSTTTGRESKGSSGMETGDVGLRTETDQPKKQARRRWEDNNEPSSLFSDTKNTSTSSEKEGNEGASWEKRGEENDSLNDLLQTFAKMAIPKSDHEYCPLCFKQFKIGEEFSNHVHKCLDKMETNLKQRDDDCFPGGDCPNGVKCTITTAEHFRFCRHPKVECPICCEKWHMHEINAHVTFCLNKGGGGEGDSEVEMKKASTESSSSSNNRSSSDVQQPPRLPSMSTQQMAACAKAILDAKVVVEKEGGGDDSLVNMLQRFKTLGFTRENLKNRLKEINDSDDVSASSSSQFSTERRAQQQQQQQQGGAALAPSPAVSTSFALKPPSFTFNANSFSDDQGMKKEEKKGTN
eukprot:jgi/Bigna1/72431/fgenesh1_pg.19_\